jgi:uncharacterized protein (TIGR03435 family)
MRTRTALIGLGAALAIIGLLCAPGLRGQAPVISGSQVHFNVASVKSNKSGEAATTLGFQQGGRFLAVNETLVRLMGEAYATSPEFFALPRFRIVGGPAWIDADRFDVDARVDGDPAPSPQLSHVMLQSLLADRFKLIVHEDTRDLPIYNLMTSRRDGRLGEKLHASAIDCAALAAGGGPASVTPDQPRPCIMTFGHGSLSAHAMTMSQLASVGLTRLVGRPVVDRTGLDGAYDWVVEWTPDQPSRGQGSSGTPTHIEPERPSIFTAIQEQLGLKLEPATGPVDVLVIDHIERPTED